jgi:hypothetical protein
MKRWSIRIPKLYRLTMVILLAFTLAVGNSPDTVRNTAGSAPPGTNYLPAVRAGQTSAAGISTVSQPALDSTSGATFSIDWSACGAPPTDAVTALVYAANIWGTLISSPVPIQVSACWTATLPCDGIACGDTVTYAGNFNHAPLVDTYYPIALANAVAGSDLAPYDKDINLWFDSSKTWSFATSGPPGAGYDFVSTALHELGHGLGFAGNMYENSNIGFCGNGPISWYVCPTIYDRFVVDSQGVPLLDYLETYPPTLGTRLKSDALSAGPNTLSSNGGTAARLYTPPTFALGSSINHLDPVTFGGGPNTLMLPELQAGVRAPGPVTLAILQDMGWVLTNVAANLSSAGPLAAGKGSDAIFTTGLTWPAYGGQSISYRWSASDQTPVTHTLTSLNDTLSLHWDNPGLKTLVVTATGSGAAAGVTRLVLVFDVSMSGATQGITGKAYTFNASLAPDKTLLPVTYQWQASGNAAVIHTDKGVADAMAFSWSLPGVQTITVTASLGGSSAQFVRTIQITGNGMDHHVYMPALTCMP